MRQKKEEKSESCKHRLPGRVLKKEGGRRTLVCQKNKELKEKKRPESSDSSRYLNRITIMNAPPPPSFLFLRPPLPPALLSLNRKKSYCLSVWVPFPARENTFFFKTKDNSPLCTSRTCAASCPACRRGRQRPGLLRTPRMCRSRPASPPCPCSPPPASSSPAQWRSPRSACGRIRIFKLRRSIFVPDHGGNACVSSKKGGGN